MKPTDIITTKSGLTATLYLADCLEVLPALGRVDAVITDPPYSEVTHSNAKSNRDKGHGNKAIDFAAIDFAAIRELLEHCGRVCHRWFISTMDWRHIADLERDTPAGWEFVRFGVWVKPNPMPQISADRPANGWDGIAYLHRSDKKKTWNGGGKHGNWFGGVVTNGDHPTGKPVEMVESWVERFCDKQNTILDPFMGSGTTGVAALRMGCNFIGIEISDKYYAIAKRRIAAEAAQGRLFT